MSKKAKLGPKILIIDIETSPNIGYHWGAWNQNIAISQLIEPTRMLCFAAKWYGQKKKLFYSEYHHGREEMIRHAWDLLDEADIVVTFNGKKFDVPHLNREFAEAKLAPPSPYAHVDLYQIASRTFKFFSNKLDYIVQALDLGAKVKHEGFGLWKGCLEGDKAAWKRMKEYNLGDIDVTEDLYEELRPWIKTHPHVGLFTGDTDCCPNCGATEGLTRRGTTQVGISVYPRLRCKCGKWFRSKHRVATTETRSI